MTTHDLLQTLLNELTLGVAAYDAGWKLIYAKRQATELLDRVVFESQNHILIRLGTANTTEIEESADLEPLKLVVEGPPPRILQVSVQYTSAGTSGSLRLLLLQDVTHEQE